MKNIFNLSWHSPTLMTWGSFLTRLFGFALVLPLLLTRFSTEEIALWYLFSTIIGLQLLADVGFSSTFIRVIAYAMGGASIHNLKDYSVNRTVKNTGQPNWETMEQVVATMKPIYLRLSIISFGLLAIFGTWSLLRPISVCGNTTMAWVAWGIVLITTTIAVGGNLYSSYLQGVNQIALLRRWEIFTSSGATIVNLSVLILDGNLAALIIANQSWVIINILINRRLCYKVERGQFTKFTVNKADKIVFDSVWPSAWRTGLGAIMSYGLVQISGVIYAQFGSIPQVASYLLALRLIQVVSQLSQAPFYTRLPLLAQLRSQGDLSEQVRVAKNGMILAYWTFVAGFLLLAVFATPLLDFIHSNADFVNPSLWAILGLAVFIERYGAMHIQLYSTTNKIINHIANGISGIIFLVFSWILFEKIGVYAFPVSMLVSYLGFYSWYSAKHSYNEFDLHFWSFEKTTMFAPGLLLVLYTIIAVSLAI
jgi:O-antigen/teichoic acid export membrane protein